MQTRTTPSLFCHDNISILAIIGSGIISFGHKDILNVEIRYLLGLEPINDVINELSAKDDCRGKWINKWINYQLK